MQNITFAQQLKDIDEETKIKEEAEHQIQKYRIRIDRFWHCNPHDYLFINQPQLHHQHENN